MRGWSGAHPRLASLVLAGLGLPLLGSCSLLTTMWGPPPGFLAVAQRPRSATGLYDFKGVVHCHSFRSHDSTGTIAEIGAACASVGMDFLVMTDHPSPYSVLRGKRGMVGSTLFMVGAELRVPGGTLLAFPLRHYVRPHPTLADYLQDIHSQGGLAFVGHAERFTAWSAPLIDGVEVHNLHAAARRSPKWSAALGALFTPLSWLFEHLAVADPVVLANWSAMPRYPMTAIGGNDAHANIRVLGPLGWVLGNYREIFRVLSTHVLAERLDQESIVTALRRGRSYVVLDLWRDGSGFRFFATAATSTPRHFEMGDTAPASASLRVELPVAAEIRVLRDGVELARHHGAALDLEGCGAGIYRVEVHLDSELWILSSPLRLR